MRNSKLQFVLLSIAIILLSGCGSGGSSGDSGNGDDSDTIIPWIDTHAHPTGYETDCVSETCISSAVATMAEYGVMKTIFMHPPAASANEESEASIATAVSYDEDHLFYGAGGSVLNARIQRTDDDGSVSTPLQNTFTNKVQELIDAGGIVCFGETTALHLSYAESHAFEETAPNTPLFYILADMAADNGIPIDIHMDAVAETMDTPSHFTDLSSNNPDQIQANIANFEILLAYNRDAKIVWAHVGRDTTGDMTASRVNSLMASHPNLYLQIHPVRGPVQSEKSIIDGSGTIRSEWMTVLETYEDRIVLGSDNFYEGTDGDGNELNLVQNFLQQLSSDLATKIGCENPVTIYNLSSGC